MVKSISYSGLVFFFLNEFVNYYLYLSTVGENRDGDKDEMKMRPPYSLVDQTFFFCFGTGTAGLGPAGIAG